MVGVDGTNPSPCLLLQGAAILGLNHPESLAPTTAGLSTHESEPDPARASTAAALHRGGSAAASEGCYEAEASDRATAADTRASALRGLAHADVCCASAQGGVLADAPPPAGSGCAIAITDVWVRACAPRHDEMMLHVFAGTPRLGSFADAAESLSVRVDQIDLLHGGSVDLLVRRGRRQCLPIPPLPIPPRAVGRVSQYPPCQYPLRWFRIPPALGLLLRFGYCFRVIRQ